MKSGNVLLIGNGGREHAISRCLSKCDRIKTIFVAPGNAGTAMEEKCQNVADLKVSDFDAVAKFCQTSNVIMVFVGPEDPLCRGIVNYLAEKNIPCFGPRKESAEIEGSKSWSKDFMHRHHIPTADFQVFRSADEAINFIRNRCSWDNIVVKASGLAAGKGVIVTSSRKEAEEAVSTIMINEKFGDAGKTVVLEECLSGPEVSCMAFSDGKDIVCLPPSQDHKRLLDGDLGPNTGGMGAYAPCDLLYGEDLKTVQTNVLQKAVDGLRAEGRPFVGVLYAGLMLTSRGPKVLEFNCRLGDPETQVVMPLLRTDLLEIAEACVRGTLSQITVEFCRHEYWVCVVAVSRGYPESYPKGQIITGLDKVESDGKVYVIHAGTRLHENGDVLTNGGRVLSVVATGPSVRMAQNTANLGMKRLDFEALQFRTDIGKAITLNEAKPRVSGLTYKSAGVDISAGDDFVQRIKPMASGTSRAGLLSKLGQFGSVFSPAAAGYSGSEYSLIAGTDGVGTKLSIAESCGLLDGIGFDLVAMCANDVLCHAAEPLFFLDYYACGKLRPVEASQVVQSIANACKDAGCALAGGETAEMPDFYHGNQFDLAGFVVGAVANNDLLPRINEIKPGDSIIGIESNGLHSNGFSLVRKLVNQLDLSYDQPCPFEDNVTLGEALLRPTRIYVKALLSVLRSGRVKAAVHVTGGGIIENLPRVLPTGTGAALSGQAWKWPAIFPWIAEKGRVTSQEMLRTFNCGLGMLLVTSQDDAESIRSMVADHYPSWIVGSVTDNPGVNVTSAPLPEPTMSTTVPKKVNVGVLISGSGTNLQALLDQCTNPKSRCRISVVISNIPNAYGLERAHRAGVETAVIPHRNYANREDFENEITNVLKSHNVELICLAGFMRILTAPFARQWSGKLINIHPSLLPSFKGHIAHKLVLEFGARLTGATVHFVTENVDSGAVIAQGSCPVYSDDTEDSIADRVKTEVEHKIFPEAMELVAAGHCYFDSEKNRTIWRKDGNKSSH